MANNFFGAVVLTGGGTGALDDISYAAISDGDGAICIDAVNNIVYYYINNHSLGSHFQ